MSAATEWENRPVRLTRDRTGIGAGTGRVDVPSGTTGEIVGHWVTADGVAVGSVLHLIVITDDGDVHIPATDGDIEEVASDE